MRPRYRSSSLGYLAAGCIFALVWSAPAPAQQPNLEQRFRQLDRDGDGKVSAEEFPGPLFRQIDKDGDGLLTLEEARAYYTGRRATPPATEQPRPRATVSMTPPAGGALKAADAVFELCVRDVKACAKFYRDGIGMREVETADAEQGALLEWAGCALRFRKVPGEKPEPPTGNPIKQMLASNGFRWFSLWFDDPAAIGERIVKAGYPAPVKGGNVSMTRDPDGNIVELMGVLRGASGETFTWGMAVSDAAGRGQLFESISVSGLTDLQEGMMGSSRISAAASWCRTSAGSTTIRRKTKPAPTSTWVISITTAIPI